MCMNEYIPNRYKILNKIGEGVHGVVLKAIDTLDRNKPVAIKKVALRTKLGGEKFDENWKSARLSSSFQAFHQTHLGKLKLWSMQTVNL